MNSIERYLIDNGTKEGIAKTLAAKSDHHPDIHDELVAAIEKGALPEDGIEVQGYRASDIAALAPFMNFVGVYNFLVTLRDDPARAKKQIASGFPRK